MRRAPIAFSSASLMCRSGSNGASGRPLNWNVMRTSRDLPEGYRRSPLRTPPNLPVGYCVRELVPRESEPDQPLFQAVEAPQNSIAANVTRIGVGDHAVIVLIRARHPDDLARFRRFQKTPQFLHQGFVRLGSGQCDGPIQADDFRRHLSAPRIDNQSVANDSQIQAITFPK